MIDDDDLVRHALVEWLTREGYDVRAAESGQSALAQLETGIFDAALLDIHLPDMTGIDVARQLKFEPSLEGVRIIALSGSPEYRQKAEEHGLLEFVTKPATPEVWITLLEGEAGNQASNDSGAR